MQDRTKTKAKVSKYPLLMPNPPIASKLSFAVATVATLSSMALEIGHKIYT